MHKGCLVLLFSSLLMAIPLWGQEVYVSGASPAAVRARADLEKYTHYRQSGSPINATLVVNEISWSSDFTSPVTTAICMDLISPSGATLWHKTEPVGTRPKDAVIQDLLKALAQAKPDRNGAAVKPATSKAREGS